MRMRLQVERRAVEIVRIIKKELTVLAAQVIWICYILRSKDWLWRQPIIPLYKNRFLDTLLYTVSLTRKSNEKLGFSRKGRRIVKVFPGTLADKTGKMKAGDKIVAINSVRVLNDDDDYIASLFRNSRTSVVIKLTRAGITLFSILTSMFSSLYSYLCVHLFMINSIFILKLWYCSIILW